MSTLYVGQDLRLTLTGDTDIGSGTATIEYRKPNSNTIATATTTLSTATSCICYADLTPTQLNVAGSYAFWIKVTFTSGKIGYGEPYWLRLYSPGSGG
jgi:hypothetical protein